MPRGSADISDRLARFSLGSPRELSSNADLQLVGDGYQQAFARTIRALALSISVPIDLPTASYPRNNAPSYSKARLTSARQYAARSRLPSAVACKPSRPASPHGTVRPGPEPLGLPPRPPFLSLLTPLFYPFPPLLAPSSLPRSQQDITRGREMVDDLFQGGFGAGGTHNAVLSSQEYLSQSRASFNNIEDGFYISPAFLDKMTIHIAKNFMVRGL